MILLEFAANTCSFDFQSPKCKSREIAIFGFFLFQTTINQQITIFPRLTFRALEIKRAGICSKFQKYHTLDTLAYPSELNSCPANPCQSQKPHTEKWPFSYFFGPNFGPQNGRNSKAILHSVKIYKSVIPVSILKMT